MAYHEQLNYEVYFPVRDMFIVNKLLDEYLKFGKPIYITEMAVGSQMPPTSDNLNIQLDYTNGVWYLINY